MFVNRSEISVQEAKGRAHLGDLESAAELYRSSLAANLSLRNAANYRAQLAATLAAAGDMQQAVAEGAAVLSALEIAKILSPRTLGELRLVRRAAATLRGGDSFNDRYDQAVGAMA